MNPRIPQVPSSYHEHPWRLRRQKPFSRESRQKLDGCEFSLGEWRSHDEANAQSTESRAVNRQPSGSPTAHCTRCSLSTGSGCHK